MKHPYITASLRGIGGQIKTNPIDFLVEEIPLYHPSGEGQHVHVTIEKRGMSTYEAIKKIASALEMPRQKIGYAGLKDAHAITRQTLSIDGANPDAVAKIEIPNLNILQVDRHGNKLRIGHLKGNRFMIRVRQVAHSSLIQVNEIIQQLSTKGVPNFFGKQRFGLRGNTHRLGEQLIRQNEVEFCREYLGRPQTIENLDIQKARQLVDAEKWAEALSHWPRRKLSDERKLLRSIVQANGNITGIFRYVSKKMKLFFISAFQSHLYNQLLTQRLDSLDRIEVGDIAYIHHKGASFVVDDVITEQKRIASFEISPSGPMYGTKTLLAEGLPGVREQAILTKYGLSLDDFSLPRLRIRGNRRPYRFKLTDPKVWWDEGVMVSFELPPGAYATTVMAEVMKPKE
ncbi:tRNA pseudouridine(13) synthase TruD [Anaerolineales bacterium HSG24]|nr:tRNA pseudouridine(13) synthase TruD [Anaerolineales bacterium HSG24]